MLEEIYIRYDRLEDYKLVGVDDFQEGGSTIFRFYPDGVVLSCGQASNDPIKDWVKIREWFNREQKTH